MKMKHLLFLLVLVLSMNFTSFAQLTGTKNIPGDYATLAAAIIDLNTQGVGAGGVTLNLIAGNPETAPAGGYSITTLTGTSGNQIVIQGNGNAITASSSQVAGSQTDAVFKIVGGDYITIQNFIMQENSANTVTTHATNTMTEFGVALFLVTATDGAQNNTIQNNTISLGSTYQSAIGIFSTSSSSLTNGTLEATLTTGTNSNNKFYGNTISSVAYGMYFICPPITATIFETGIDIGGSSAPTGNAITFGNATTSTLTWNRFSTTLPAGITFRNGGAGNSIRYNSITSNALAYAQSGGIGGILTTIGSAAVGVTYTSTRSNNTITLTNNGTTALTAIDFGYGISTGTIAASDNAITLNQSTIAASSAAIVGIKSNYTSATNTLNNNAITVNQSPTTAGSLTSAVTGITGAGVGTTVNVNNNTITFKQNAPTGTASYGSGAINYIDVGASSGAVNVNSNQLLTTGSTIRSTGTCNGINHTSGTITVGITINLNTINIDRIAASGTITGTNESTTPSTVAHTITNNTITFTNLTGTSVANGIMTLGGASSTGTIKSINSNTINISGSFTGTAIGIQTGYSYGTINNNSVTISSSSPTVTGLQATGTGSGAYTVAGNTVSLTSLTTSPTAMAGINVGATGPFQVYNNTFTGLNFTGVITASPTISAIALAVGTGNNIYNNVINNISVGAATSTANPVVRGIAITGGTSTNVYKNKIYGITTQATGTSTLVSGITISGGTTNNIYNNFIGDLTAPAAASTDAIRGINITSTTTTSTNNLFFNSVYINASSTGANFGTTGIFHTSSATSTTAALNLINNIIVNTSTPAGTGLTVAYRRSLGTAGTLANYSGTSNNNIFYAGTPGASRLIYSDGTSSAQTVASYKSGVFTAGTIAPRDANSITENPVFVSTTGSNSNYLHINTTLPTQIESGGASITTPFAVTDDYDGDLRNATPDIGADEFIGVGADMTGPSISYTNLFQTGLLTNRTFTATISDASSVDYNAGNAPRVYFKRKTDDNAFNDNTNTTQGWKYFETVSSSSPVSFTIDYSLLYGGTGAALGDTIQYFVIAVDLSSAANFSINSGTFASTPTSTDLKSSDFPVTGTINKYAIISAPLSGDYTVGTAAFNSITGRNITFEKVTKKVMREVVDESAINEMKRTTTDERAITDGKIADSSSSLVMQKTRLQEVEEISWVPMENGVLYDGPLYVKKSEEPTLLYPEGVQGVYGTITIAIADLNLRGVSGATSFTLTDAAYSSETLPITINIANESLPTATNTVTIKPKAGVTSTISGAAASSRVFTILNSYVTIDGSNSGGTSRDLTISNTSATSPQVLLVGSVGAVPITNVTIKNCNIVNGVNTSSALIISDGTAAATAGRFNNITIQNNNIKKAFVGIYSIAVVAAGNGSGLNINNNDLSSTGTDAIGNVGIYVQGVDGASVSQNTIANFDGTTSQDDKGIWLGTGTVNSVVEKNNINTLKYTGTGGYGASGIAISTGTLSANITVKNNLIYNLSGDGFNYTTTLGDNIHGIYIYGSSTQSGVNVYFNSINLYGNTLNNTNAISTGICLGTGSTANLKDNIISNNLGLLSATGLGSSGIFLQTGVSQLATSNYNDIYVSPSGTGVKYIGQVASTGYSTLTAWQTASTQDGNSLNANPEFKLNTDLQPFSTSPALGAGNPVSGITTDFTGVLRSATTPSIGAYENGFVAASVDWCNLQWPQSGAIGETQTYNVYAQVWEPSITPGGGQGAGIQCWIGYNSANTNPNTWTNWVLATYNLDSGNNDEYVANIGTNLPAGTYYYASRFQITGGNYQYGGYSGGGGGFWDGTNYVSGQVTVSPLVATVPYSQNFDGVTAPALPAGFLVENTNADGVLWTNTAANPKSTPNAMKIGYNLSVAMDDWFFSPGLNLTAGTTYKVSFWYCAGSASYTEKLEVKWGTSKNSAGMTSPAIFSNSNIVSASYSEGIGTFTPPTSGVYYLGWHGFSDADKLSIYVDDINITEMPSLPTFSITPTSKDFGAIALAGSSTSQTFTITNSGGGTLTISSISLTGLNSDQFALTDANTYPISLAANATATVSVVFSPTLAGGKTAQLNLVHNAAGSPSVVTLTGNGGFDWGGGQASNGNYFFSNSEPGSSGAPSHPTFDWIDPVTNLHTQLTTMTSGDLDDGYFQTNLPFTFNYFGTNFTTVTIGSNGFIVPGTAVISGYGDATFPNTSTPNNVIAGLWQDLDANTFDYPSAKIYYGGNSQYFAITYWHVYDYSGTPASNTNYMSFQIILYSDGKIRTQYYDTESTLPLNSVFSTDAIIGIENSTGDAGIGYRVNSTGGPILGSPVAVEFGISASALPIELASFTANASDRDVNLNWNTKTEVNSFAFEMERKNDQQNQWIKVGSLQASGNSNSPKEYFYTDKKLTTGSYSYRLKMIDNDGTFTYSDLVEVEIGVPKEFSISQNYPNPFNPTTRVDYQLPYQSSVTIELYSITGERVGVLLDAEQAAGYYTLDINGSALNLASGVYIYRITAQDKSNATNFMKVKKMIMMK